MSTGEIEGRPPSALMPVWAARLVGFAALGALAALEWQRMIDGLPSARALLWVAVAVASAAAVIACDRLSAYAYPRRIEFTDSLPKTLTGKIRRIELREAESGPR